MKREILAVQAESAVSVNGVILAPACKAPSTTDVVGVDDHTGPRSTITTVCNREACDLLGGLDPLFRHMTPACRD